MEPPFKRQRLSGGSYPDIDLHVRRAQNDFRLKSIFESIFEKYDRDFDGIGDEIDMETGEIVVNNGHVQNMTNERDIGDTEYSREETKNSDCEDRQSLAEYNDKYTGASASCRLGDTAIIQEPETSEQSDFDADSQLGDVPADSYLHQLNQEPMRAASLLLDEEEDELAGSDIEWASSRKDRLAFQERFCVPKNKPTFLDEPAIEPVWRVPPLPNDSQSKPERGQVSPTSLETTRDYSDDERAGISLWTPEVKKSPRRKQVKAGSTSRRSLAFARIQENNANGMLAVDTEFARRKVKWTQEEDELLAHLKKTTNLSALAMEPYFPGRQHHTIGCHWSYMINCGNVSPKSQASTTSVRRISLCDLPSSNNSLPPEKNRRELEDHETISEANEPKTDERQTNGGFSKARSTAQSSSKPVALGDHYINSSCQSGDGRKLASKSNLISNDVEVQIKCSMPETSNVSRFGCRIADSGYQRIERHASTNQSNAVQKPFEIDDDSSTGRKDDASNLSDQGFRLISRDDCGASVTSPTTSINVELDSTGAEPLSDGLISPTTDFPGTRVDEVLGLSKQAVTNNIEKRREESITSTADCNNPRRDSMAQRLQKTRSTDLILTTARPSDHGKPSPSRESQLEVTSRSIRKQIVQVVIPLVPSSKTHINLPLVTTETEDPTSTTQLSATTESTSVALDLSLHQEEKPATLTPTRSSSVAAAESQYAASAAFIPNGVRTSLGPEIADSQPVSTMPVVATPGLEPGIDATRPIILDVESPPLMMSPDVALSVENKLEETTKNIILKCDSQPLPATSGIASPVRERIEEAPESDILESGSHPFCKSLAVARSLPKRAKKKAITESSSLIWIAMDDYSEDELSYL